MHTLVLSGIAALAVLAIATGGRDEPAGPRQASFPMTQGRDVTIIALAAPKPWPRPGWTVSLRAGAEMPR